MKTLNDLDEAALYVMSLVPGDLKIALPLGLGKPNQLANKIYNHFKLKNPQRRLEIYTALSLDLPHPKTSLEKKLLNPFLDRHFGKDYPRLAYVQDLLKSNVPANISLHEFYFMAGQYLSAPLAQQNYISLNYTHAAKALLDRGLEVIIQLVAQREINGKKSYSLSCNPDMTLDVVELGRAKNKKIHVIGVVHPDLPFLGGDAEVSGDFFTAMVDSPEVRHQLFALPRGAVDEVDHMIGFLASQMVEDGGTLQIGIGSLSDALVHAMLLRQKENSMYLKLCDQFWQNQPKPEGLTLQREIFDQGLYATSEMVMDGFMHLRQAGILKRFIFDEDEQKKRYLHGAFFLGSKNLYAWLRNLSGEDYSGLSMTRVSKVNDLYDPHELALRRQRKKARFFNTCMQVHLLGGVVSDTLLNGSVISGVGGQYNFVAMSQELVDAHSILMLRSTRTKGGQKHSNIISENGELTISRHLRDIVITEYGIASLKGKTDAEVITTLIEISDSQFQDELVSWGKKNKKISDQYQVPEYARKNNPEKIKNFISNQQNLFSSTPFGSDFDPTEFKLIQALSGLKEKSKWELVKTVISGFLTSTAHFKTELQRLDLIHAKSLSDFVARWVVLGVLS